MITALVVWGRLTPPGGTVNSPGDVWQEWQQLNFMHSLARESDLDFSSDLPFFVALLQPSLLVRSEKLLTSLCCHHS